MQLLLAHPVSSPLRATDHLVRMLVSRRHRDEATLPVSVKNATCIGVANATSSGVPYMRLVRELRALVTGHTPPLHANLLQDLFSIRPKV